MSNLQEEAVPLKSRGKSKKPEIVATTYEFPYMRKPVKRSFREVIYDSDTGKFFGRTPKNWGKKISESWQHNSTEKKCSNPSSFMVKKTRFPHVLLIYHSSS